MAVIPLPLSLGTVLLRRRASRTFGRRPTAQGVVGKGNLACDAGHGGRAERRHDLLHRATARRIGPWGHVHAMGECRGVDPILQQTCTVRVIKRIRLQSPSCNVLVMLPLSLACRCARPRVALIYQNAAVRRLRLATLARLGQIVQIARLPDGPDCADYPVAQQDSKAAASSSAAWLACHRAVMLWQRGCQCATASDPSSPILA
jgi:hypothetical protein